MTRRPPWTGLIARLSITHSPASKAFQIPGDTFLDSCRRDRSNTTLFGAGTLFAVEVLSNTNRSGMGGDAKRAFLWVKPESGGELRIKQERNTLLQPFLFGPVEL